MRDASLADAMHRRTARTPGCWNWVGNITPTGYGRVFFAGSRSLAHRVAYELAKGTIPDGLVIDHLCRNTRCVNPDHLEAVTIWENTARGKGITAQRARATECKRGHALDDVNTIIQRGYRLCRTCYEARNAFWHDRRRKGTRPPQLTANLVLEARRRNANGEAVTALAREFGVNRGTLRNAVKGYTWRHVEVTA